MCLQSCTQTHPTPPSTSLSTLMVMIGGRSAPSGEDEPHTHSPPLSLLAVLLNISIIFPLSTTCDISSRLLSFSLSLLSYHLPSWLPDDTLSSVHFFFSLMLKSNGLTRFRHDSRSFTLLAWRIFTAPIDFHSKFHWISSDIWVFLFNNTGTLNSANSSSSLVPV